VTILAATASTVPNVSDNSEEVGMPEPADEQQQSPSASIKLDREFYTVPDIAFMLNLQERTIRGYLKSKKLKGFKMRNGLWRIPQADLRAFLDEEFGQSA
jgi:excisionase family DNA binding protein